VTRALGLTVVLKLRAAGLSWAGAQEGLNANEGARSKSFVFAEFVLQNYPACEEMRRVIDAILADTPLTATKPTTPTETQTCKTVPGAASWLTWDQLDEIFPRSGLGAR
jgi:hypothetical protein